MRKVHTFVSALVLAAASLSAQAVTLSEDFSGAFPAWESAWFGVNTDALNYYCHARGCVNRGNNPEGLWLAGTGGNGSVTTIDVILGSAFAATVSSLDMDLATFSGGTVSVFDKDGALIFSQDAGASSAYVHYTINSGNGIGHFSISGSASGNTSIDNVAVNVSAVPEVQTWALMLAGLAATGALVRRRQRRI